MSQGEGAQQPGPERGSSRVRSPGRLSEVLRLPERHHPQGTGMFDRRGFQRGVAKVRFAAKRGRMVSAFYYRHNRTITYSSSAFVDNHSAIETLFFFLFFYHVVVQFFFFLTFSSENWYKDDSQPQQQGKDKKQ